MMWTFPCGAIRELVVWCSDGVKVNFTQEGAWAKDFEGKEGSATCILGCKDCDSAINGSRPPASIDPELIGAAY